MVQEVVLVAGRGIPCFDFLGGWEGYLAFFGCCLDLLGLFPYCALELMVAFARGSRRGVLERSVPHGVILGD